MNGLLSQNSLKNFALDGGNNDIIFSSGDSTLFDASGYKNNGQLTTYAKMKEVKIDKSGTIRTVFALSGVSGMAVYGQIYKNDIPVGTERYTTSATAVTFTEDLNVVSGDLIQVYTRSSNPNEQTLLTTFLIKIDATQFGIINLK